MAKAGRCLGGRSVTTLRRYLSRWLMGALALGALVLVTASYLNALAEWSSVLDQQLRQVALAVLAHHRFDEGVDAGYTTRKPSEFDFLTQFFSPTGAREFGSDPDVRLPFSKITGYTTVEVNGEQWRLYTLATAAGVVQAAQRVTVRETLAAESAGRLVLPFLLMMPLIAAMQAYALKRGLAPLDRAAEEIHNRSPSSLTPIPQSGLPAEVQPMVEAINGLMAKLAEALESQRRFVADAAHELRTPLAALGLQMQLLERSEDEAARARALADLKAGFERAQRAIRQLLDLSRLEQAAGEQRVFELGALAASVVKDFSAKAGYRNIDLGLIAPEQALAVQGDPHKIRILLNNLVENALRYIPEGGRVDVRVGREAEGTLLEVVDDGPGIAAAERERVFDRFYRGSAGRSQMETGSGLGLAIVKAVADAHGARVNLAAASADGQRGLRIRVVFPPLPQEAGHSDFGRLPDEASAARAIG